MAELQKIARVIKKVEPTAPHHVVLVLDATTGQNALSQIGTFKELVDITGLIFTQLNGTARGGVLVARAEKDRTSVEKGKSVAVRVDLCGRQDITKKKKKKK